MILNSSTKCQTGSLWTGLCRAKPSPAASNRRVRSVLLWDITQCRVVIPYWHFRTTYRYHLQRSANQREEQTTDFNWHNTFWHIVHLQVS